jgi:hypothetical protein
VSAPATRRALSEGSDGERIGAVEHVLADRPTNHGNGLSPPYQ